MFLKHIFFIKITNKERNMTDVIKLLQKINKSQDLKLLDKFPDEDIKECRKILDDKYYNSSSPIIEDWKYDLFFEYLVGRIPSQKYNIGSSLRSGSNSSLLPYWLGSLDKKRDEKSINRWKEKYTGPYFLTEKLDGVSLMIQFQKGKSPKLFTRGDGKSGSDISYLAKYLNLPKIDKDISVRGELIISTENFKNYNEDFDNPRNMVSGIVNAKTLKAGIEAVDFVAYQILDTNKKISSQISLLKEYGFLVPLYMSITSSKLSEESLSSALDKFKSNSSYSIDGVVVRDDKEYEVNDSGNPDYSFAFKRQGQLYKTTVIEVEWGLTKSGSLKPTVKITPTNVGDVVISSCYGFNAKYIVDNKIGPGSEIEITRSGDVIPYIVNIIKSTKAQLPPETDYYWNDSDVDIMADLTSKSQYYDKFKIRYLYDLVSSLGVLNLGESTMKKIYLAGFDSLEKILNSKKDSFKDIENMGIKSSERIYNSIQSMMDYLTVDKLVGCSNILGIGIGEKKVNAIIEEYPDIFTEAKDKTPEEYKTMISSIKGFSDISSDKISENMIFAKNLVRKYSKYIKKIEVGNKCENIKVVFTGFRDKKLEEKIKNEGGIIQSAVSKKTDYVLVKNVSEQSTKTEKAKSLGVEIIDIDKFLEKFKFL